MNTLRTMYANGELRDAPRLSDAQLHMQIHCPGCHRTRSLPKKTRRKKKPRIRDREKLRILEKVYVDVVGPRCVPSLWYRGERGNQCASAAPVTLLSSASAACASRGVAAAAAKDGRAQLAEDGAKRAHGRLDRVGTGVLQGELLLLTPVDIRGFVRLLLNHVRVTKPVVGRRSSMAP